MLTEDNTNDDNKQEQKYRVVLNGKVVNEDFKSLQEAVDWAKVFVNEESGLEIQTYYKPKLLLD
jgi:uncharacterized membrane protein YcaP (DUF421 family)